MTTPHRVVNPDTLAPPTGFAHAVVPAAGRTVYLGGQTAHDADGRLVADDLVGQFDAAAANLVTALRAAGGAPEHLVALTIFTTDGDGYRAALGALGRAYRRHLGAHYPATSWFEVAGLFDPAAFVELVGVAVVPA
jgi:enamine deaminase RidA (YjgF/YER057c/UK114 family)